LDNRGSQSRICHTITQALDDPLADLIFASYDISALPQNAPMPVSEPKKSHDKKKVKL